MFFIMPHEIIGITGTSASGKDTAAKHIEAEHGYMHVSTADMVREVALEEYGSIEQMVLRQVGDELRRRLGKSALCQIAIEKYKDEKANYQGLVISGYRSVPAAQLIRDNHGLLLFLDAPLETRFARAQDRHRAGESSTFEQFREFEEEEYSGQLATGQNLAGIRQISDINLQNTFEDRTAFKLFIDELLGF